MKIENEAFAPVAVTYIASAEAIFIGCTSVMIRLSWSPERVVRTPAINIIHMPNLSAGRMVSKCWLRARCQAATEMIRPAETMKHAKIVCGKEASTIGLVSNSPILVSSARPFSGFIWNATGFCMKALAARMK